MFKTDSDVHFCNVERTLIFKLRNGYSNFSTSTYSNSNKSTFFL